MQCEVRLNKHIKVFAILVLDALVQSLAVRMHVLWGNRFAYSDGGSVTCFLRKRTVASCFWAELPPFSIGEVFIDAADMMHVEVI